MSDKQERDFDYRVTIDGIGSFAVRAWDDETRDQYDAEALMRFICGQRRTQYVEVGAKARAGDALFFDEQGNLIPYADEERPLGTVIRKDGDSEYTVYVGGAE